MAADDEFGYHEALDRTHVLVCMFEDHIASHAVITGNEELKIMAEKIAVELAELYQAIGSATEVKFG